MKKFYKVFLLFILLIILSTFNPKELNFTKNNNTVLKIENIKIEGNILINENEIEEQLKKIYKKNIFSLKKKDIEDPLKKINFLDKVEVKKKFPNTIIIRVFETKPIAVLFKDKSKFYIDNKSNLIPYSEKPLNLSLPSIFGNESENEFISFFEQLKKNNFPLGEVKNFYFFKIGRWDLELTNNQIIKFPDNNISDAITKSIEILNNKNFRNYKIIDFRVDDKIIVD
jgi:cell division protein FtsQ